MKRKKVRSQFVQFVIREGLFDRLEVEMEGYKTPSVSLFIKKILEEMELGNITLNDIIKLRFEKNEEVKNEI